MRSAAQLLLGILGLVVVTPWVADAATISGTVAGPDGAAFRGAFVQARNAKSKIVVSVLSDRDGKYRVENLPAGEYRLQIKAPGYKSDPKSGVNLTADQSRRARLQAAERDGALERHLHVAGHETPAGGARPATCSSSIAWPATASSRAWLPSRATRTAGATA